MSNDGDDHNVPPQLSVNLPSLKDVCTTTKRAREAHLPVDVLLLTVKNCEFLACYMQLNNPYKCWFDGLGYVYFEDVDESQDDKVKVALMRCHKGSSGPGGSLISVKNADTVLRPKAVISVGTCSGLNTEKTKLGDVVVSAKLRELSTGMRSYVSRRFLNVIKHSADGWAAPLKNPEAREINVHCDGEFLSGPEQVSVEWRHKQLAESHPQATAMEMEGEGIYTAAFDDQLEWLTVKGIADYADGAEFTTASWSTFSSVMAASVVAHILSDTAVFCSWPHYGDGSEQSAASQSKGESPLPSTRDPKHVKLEDSATAFLKWSQNQLCSFYNSTASQVMITPWDPDNTMDIDEVYVELSLLRDDRKLAGTTKEELEDYSEVFKGQGHHLIPKRILVYGRPGIGKSTFTKKLAVDWSRGEKEVLKKFDVLLLIKLRDVCNTQDICAMLQKAELLSADDPVVFDQLYDYILQNQQKVLLVLDGYDEYSAEKSSPVHRIWRGSLLRDCIVIVTTRPSKEDELRSPSHVQFEINGFSYSEVRRFALKFLNDPSDLDEFIDYLSKHTLWGVAEIPLLLLMLCLVWNEKDHQGLPTSRADLYERFIQTLFNHLIVKDLDNLDKEFTSSDEYKEGLSKLGKQAFDALLEDCLHFKLSKLPEDIRFLIEKFVAVGFFQISKLSSSSCPEKIVCFLHKSIQEFLSAWFIVKELMDVKKETLTCLTKIDSFDKIQKVDEVLKFVCEMSPKAASAVFSHLQIIGEKEGLTERSFTETPSVEDLSENQRDFHTISLDYLLSCPASDRQALCPLFLRCVNSVLIIDVDLQLPTVAREHLLKIPDLPKPDYVFFDNSGLDEEVNDDVLSIMRDFETVIVTCFGDTTAVIQMCSALNVEDVFLKKFGQQMILCLTRIAEQPSHYPLRATELLSVLTSAPESPQKLVDHVSENQGNNSALYSTENTSDQTRKHSLSFVRVIEFHLPNFISYSAQVMRSLNSRILSTCFSNNLQELTLTGMDFTSEFPADVAKSLHQAPNLHQLDLSRNASDFSSVSYIAENLHHVTQLSKLRPSYVQMGEQGCRLLARSLKYINQLQRLDLSGNPLGQGITELATHLCNVPHLTALKLRDTAMGEEEVTAVACSLKHITELKKLGLSFNPLGQGITELATHLCNVPHLTALKLRDTLMGEEEVTAVACSLKHITELKKLDLSFNPLGQGITELATHLCNVPHLTKLRLTDTQMGEEEVTAVARALKYLPELEELELPCNPLGRGVSELTQHLSSVPQLEILQLLSVKMTKKEASELWTAVREGKIYILTDYHDDHYDRLLTDAELKEEGVTFDDD